MQDFEKLGTFYLGRVYDVPTRQRSEDLLLYDMKDLVTHAVVVGMTGSGKTGLCIDLLEEAAIDHVPALVIDPKGDLGNLMLTFPGLRPEDFRPWVAEGSPESESERWGKGLAEWGQDGARIQRLRDAAEVRIYTPGSTVGLPLAILQRFEVPPAAVLEDRELLTARVQSVVTSLLGLVGITADPIKSREHVLLSNLLSTRWAAGESLDLAGLIALVQIPPFDKIGVLDLESFYPGPSRFELAMQLNHLLAAPGFSQWMEGAPMDLGTLLYTPEGRPRIAIVSIAHLGDAERMFVVSLLLHQVLAWTRTQSGTTTLRALLYMDEIAGYLPPVSNPPSKAPLLTMLKQARAFGVGVVLATQNPVDLDYKALSNAGTWFVGRLQTEQDKARLLDGLEGALAGRAFDRAAMDKTLSALPKRVFLMNDVHEDGPVTFETRWALSYLRGPLDRSQVKMLMDPLRVCAPAPAPGLLSRPAGADRPVLPPDVEQYFLPRRGPAGAPVVYEPMLLGFGTARFVDSKSGIDHETSVCSFVPFGSGAAPVRWDERTSTELDEGELEREPVEGASFVDLPPEALKVRKSWAKDFADAVFRTHTLTLLRSETLGEVSAPGETEQTFRARLQLRAREERDARVEAIRAAATKKITALEDRLRKAEQKVEVQEGQARTAQVGTLVSIGSAVLGSLFGRKSAITGAGTAARGVSKSLQEKDDIRRAQENVTAMKGQLDELRSEIEAEVKALDGTFDMGRERFEERVLRPKKTHVKVRAVVLAWVPQESAWNPSPSPRPM